MSMHQAMNHKCHYPPYPDPMTKIKIRQDLPSQFGSDENQNKNLKVNIKIQELKIHYRRFDNPQGTPLGNPIHHIDVWGEGRIFEETNKSDITRTGFQDSYNININQGITLSGYIFHAQPIPNLLPLCNYGDGLDMIPDDSVKVITIMGAPIKEYMASEIARVVLKDDGRLGCVITYGYDYNSNEIKILKNELISCNIERSKQYTLEEKFRKISLEPLIVFSKIKNSKLHVNSIVDSSE